MSGPSDGDNRPEVANGGEPDAVAPISYCYRHPRREALIRCTRCDRPICPDCMRPASVGFHCPDDVDRASRTVRAPRTAVGAKLMQAPPYVTIALVALNVAAYLVTAAQAVGGWRDPTASSLFNKWQLQPIAVRDDHRYYDLLTSAFLHVSPLHIASNMLALAIIGPPLEQLLGRWRFAAVYFLAALGGSAAIFAFGNSLQPVVGASGAVFGLFGAALLFVRRLGLDLQWLVAIIVINFALTFSISGISKLGHLGGFAVGVLAGLAIGGLPTVRSRLEPRVQLSGLGAVLALIVIVVGLRTATW
jgi:membrane associated rhomboid family serine protease